MTAMRLKRYPSPSGGIALGKMGVGATMMMMMRSILPTGARWVEYLQSTGTQWIDTGYVPTANTNASITYETLITSGTDSNAFFGSRLAALESAFSIMQHSVYSSLRLRWDYGKSLISFNSIPVLSGVHTITTNGNAATYDGTTTVSGGAFTASGKSIWLFAINNNGSALVPHKGLRVSVFEIHDRQSLVRCFAPIAIGTTGYMLDILTGEYLPFGNKGTGDFVIGPDINAPAI